MAATPRAIAIAAEDGALKSSSPLSMDEFNIASNDYLARKAAVARPLDSNTDSNASTATTTTTTTTTSTSTEATTTTATATATEGDRVFVEDTPPKSVVLPKKKNKASKLFGANLTQMTQKLPANDIAKVIEKVSVKQKAPLPLPPRPSQPALIPLPTKVLPVKQDPQRSSASATAFLNRLIPANPTSPKVAKLNKQTSGMSDTSDDSLLTYDTSEAVLNGQQSMPTRSNSSLQELPSNTTRPPLPPTISKPSYPKERVEVPKGAGKKISQPQNDNLKDRHTTPTQSSTAKTALHQPFSSRSKAWTDSVTPSIQRPTLNRETPSDQKGGASTSNQSSLLSRGEQEPKSKKVKTDTSLLTTPSARVTSSSAATKDSVNDAEQKPKRELVPKVGYYDDKKKKDPSVLKPLKEKKEASKVEVPQVLEQSMARDQPMEVDEPNAQDMAKLEGPKVEQQFDEYDTKRRTGSPTVKELAAATTKAMKEIEALVPVKSVTAPTIRSNREPDEDDELMMDTSEWLLSSAPASAPNTSKPKKKKSIVVSDYDEFSSSLPMEEETTASVNANKKRSREVEPKFLDDHDTDDGYLKWCGLNVMRGEFVFATWTIPQTQADSDNEKKGKKAKEKRKLYYPCQVINYDPVATLFQLTAPPDQPQPPALYREEFFTRVDPEFLTCKLHPEALYPYYEDDSNQTKIHQVPEPLLSQLTSLLPILQQILDGTHPSLHMDAYNRGDTKLLQGLSLNRTINCVVEALPPALREFADARGLELGAEFSGGEAMETCVEEFLSKALQFPKDATAVEETPVVIPTAGSENSNEFEFEVGVRRRKRGHAGDGGDEKSLSEMLRRDRLMVWVVIPELGKRLSALRRRVAEDEMKRVDRMKGDAMAVDADANLVAMTASSRVGKRKKVDWVSRLFALRESLLLGKRLNDEKNANN
ncbi:hypothetical protein HDU99_001228 [Rhizoclosmatium hyalinum]|nr:hypothetical protein HDU99_001228 [Rhizoclosmatium hyalinum]